MITFKNSNEKSVTAEEIIALYKQDSWWLERQLDDIEEYILQKDNTYLVFNDGRFRGYIEDFVIKKSFQSKNIELDFLNYVCEENNHIDLISLFCSSKLESFYQKLSFQKTR
ncbi:GNAT family N-acetyltransferase [Macrococcus animalis]|uniref:GNAT family N-acetyltransferase n=1 Tax=Macrococcus animalis TaxID=3395467 RepID=UPI0039BDA73C